MPFKTEDVLFYVIMAGIWIVVSLGTIIFVGSSLWATILIGSYVYAKIGLVGVIVGVILFPAFYALTPWYAGFVDGYWTPLLVGYFPLLMMFALYVLATAFNGAANVIVNLLRKPKGPSAEPRK